LVFEKGCIPNAIQLPTGISCQAVFRFIDAPTQVRFKAATGKKKLKSLAADRQPMISDAQLLKSAFCPPAAARPYTKAPACAVLFPPKVIPTLSFQAALYH
jgi:hypothetical protein